MVVVGQRRVRIESVSSVEGKRDGMKGVLCEVAIEQSLLWGNMLACVPRDV